MFPHLVDPAAPSAGRAALAAVKAAGRHRMRRQRRLVVGIRCAAALLVLLGVGGVVSQRVRGGQQLAAGTAAPAADGHGLTHVDWQLQALTVSKVPQDLPGDREVVLRFDGADGFSGEACNRFGGTVTIDAAALRFSHDGTTAMQCYGVIAEVERHIGRLLRDEVSWSLTGGVLRLEADGVLALFVDGGAAFPTRDLHVLAHGSGASGEHQFQFGYRGDGMYLLWEGRPEPGRPWGSAGMAVYHDGRTEVQALPFGERTFVFGYMPPGTARAEYRSASGVPAALDGAPLPGGSFAFWGFVVTAGGHVAGFDEGGREVARSRQAPGP